MRKKNNPNELTTREKSILEFICQKIWDSGFPPTVREIGEAVVCARHPPCTII